MSNEIRITDLAHPVLTEAQRAAIAYGETVPLDFTEAAVLEAARQRTGLDDFGPEDFRERLQLLIDEWGSDTQLRALGRLTLFNYLVRYASNRLLIQDVLTRHPEIHDQQVVKPIIVVGLPRSGTTHMLNLLAADTRLRSLPLWESYEPLPLPGETLLPDGTDPRWQRCQKEWEGMQAMTPLLAAMHPMNPDHIHEELELMGPDFASYNFEWLSHSPRWRDHYYSHDQTPHYEYMKTVLKILQWRQPDGRRWVLKCPQHLEQLPALMKVFPDATVVVTHRDPVAVIQSSVTMLAYGFRMKQDHIDLPELLAYWTDRIEHLLRACVNDHDAVPAAQRVDAPFHDFMADEMATVERIYACAGLPMTDTARQQLTTFLADHPRGKHGQVVYNFREDFGVEPAELRKRFAFYFEASPARPEAK